MPLAYALKEICYANWASDPPRAAAAAAALGDLATLTPDPQINALSAWTAGIAALMEGAMERALEQLDDAARRFINLGMADSAAATRVSKLIALAMLGRYEEAVICGLEARDTFLAAGDTLAAGKVEQNLGTIAWRRDRYHEAEQFHRAARERFVASGAVELLVAAENGLANALASQSQVREAAAIYERALELASEAGLELRQAEIECNLGNLARAQGRYDRALDYLERSRRRYAALGMAHESAYADQELAEAYLDLNMAQEAATIYARVAPTFATLGMRFEQAWAIAHHGQAAVMLGRYSEAAAYFETARRLFNAEGSQVSAALAEFFEARLAYQRSDYAAALEAACSTEQVFTGAGSYGRALLARLLRGEALGKLQRFDEAHSILISTLQQAEHNHLPQIAQRCHTALGLLAIASGDLVAAEAALVRAVAMIEELRAPLPSEEIRTAFIADKLDPYSALILLCLQHDPPRIVEALTYAEQARARALAEMLGRSVQTLLQPRDAFEARLVERLTELREQLNWLYSQLTDNLADNNLVASDMLQEAIREREAATLELSRRLQLRGGTLFGEVEQLNLAGLRDDLGMDTALLAYYSLDGELIAFVVTDEVVEVARGLADEGRIEELMGQLRFQIEALRRGAGQSNAHSDQLLRRVRHYLGQLYTLLIAPLKLWLGTRRLAIVPHRTLHYLPFHALYDGQHYLVDHHELCTVPSASVLRYCLRKPVRPRRRAVLFGVPDARAPRVRHEVLALAPLFHEAVTLLDKEANTAELRRQAPTADLLHLACHGTFRPDNPLFSALHLADGRFTTRDAYALELHCDLVVLSACETGVSRVAPGDELIGLARGFFAAGAPALLVSLWTVDDASTALLMTHFYTRLRDGANPAQALRAAQRALMCDYPHPFFWAPFVLMGRW